MLEGCVSRKVVQREGVTCCNTGDNSHTSTDVCYRVDTKSTDFEGVVKKLRSGKVKAAAAGL